MNELFDTFSSFITLFIYFQKRKTLRASMAIQRQYNVGLNSVSKSVSQGVDRNRYPKLSPIPRGRGPETAWNNEFLSQSENYLLTQKKPGEQDVIRNRRHDDKSLKPPPRYMPTYATDVSHLVV